MITKKNSILFIRNKKILYFWKKILKFLQMDEEKKQEENIIDTSLITVALSGATGGAMIGGFFGGIIGGIVGGVAGTAITGFSEYENRRERRKRLRNELKK